MRNKIKKLRYLGELLIVKASLFLFKILGSKKSSDFGGWLARKIGKFIPVHKLAKNNLCKAMPHLNEEQSKQILDDMWDNLGRIVGEFVHVSTLNSKDLMKHINVDQDSLTNIEFIKNNYRGGIIFSGHIGNWEIGSRFFSEYGFNIKILYRPLSNNFVDDLTASMRGVELISKGASGSKQIIREIKNGNYVVILMDQRVSNGIEVPFFGRNAMTTTSVAKLALKYNVPIIPVRSIRIGRRFAFDCKIEKPIEFKKIDGINDASVRSLTIKINSKLEEWIREYPSQWFWVHDRWRK